MGSVQSAGDVIAASYTFMCDLKSRGELDQIRWCYQLVAFHDMVKVCTPKATGKVIGVHMKTDIVAVFNTMFAGEQIKIDEALENFAAWSL